MIATNGFDPFAILPSIQDRALSAKLPADWHGRVVRKLSLEAKLLRSLTSYEEFKELVCSLLRSGEGRELSRLLFTLTKDDLGRRRLVSDYSQRARSELTQERLPARRAYLSMMVNLLRNLGVGEIVMIAPEGPHAEAGGLSQVITGLSRSLSAQGLSITLITPLYESGNGNKHRSAEQILLEGVSICGRKCQLESVGDIQVVLGPTSHAETGEGIRQAETASVKIYSAECDNVRILFIRNAEFCDRLYPDVWPDEQLRRSLFFSRAALQLICSGLADINPHVVITHDWFTALVPILLKTDPAFSDGRFSNTQTLHMLHNCGLDYQGRIPFKQWEQNLWPMLNLGGEHSFGIQDRLDPQLMNLTRGAIFHADRVLTVSRQYAEELFTAEHGEGLDDILREKKETVFGISNGIDLATLRQKAWGDIKALGSQSVTTRTVATKAVLKHKAAAKAELQCKLNLNSDPNARVLSFVGRIAEQKGISLLLAQVGGCALLERLLIDEPTVQLAIGGPLMSGDPLAEELKETITDLARRYPGRIAGVYDYLEHTSAVRMVLGSDLLLMPSRYEPGGIVQLEALAVGTPVVARRIGGIAATLIDYRSDREQGNAFLFDEFAAVPLLNAIRDALCAIASEKIRARLVKQAITAMHDWSARTSQYLNIFQEAGGVFNKQRMFEHLRSEANSIVAISPRLGQERIMLCNAA